MQLRTQNGIFRTLVSNNDDIFFFWKDLLQWLARMWKSAIIVLPKRDVIRQDAGLRLSDYSKELLDALAQRKFPFFRTQQVYNNTRD